MEILKESAYEEFAERQLKNAIELAIKALESAEYWAKRCNVGTEGAWDLNIAKLNAEAAQISTAIKETKVK